MNKFELDESSDPDIIAADLLAQVDILTYYYIIYYYYYYYYY